MQTFMRSLHCDRATCYAIPTDLSDIELTRSIDEEQFDQKFFISSQNVCNPIVNSNVAQYCSPP